MRANDDLKRLRAEIAKRAKAADAKARRITAKGVKFEGTVYDPRKPKGHENHLNTKQAQAYLTRLNNFMSRGVQFVPSKTGSAIPTQELRHYVRAQETNVKLGIYRQMLIDAGQKKMYIDNGKLVASQQDLHEFRSMLWQNKNSIGGTPYAIFRKTSQSFKDVKGVRELTQMLLSQQQDRDFLPNKIKKDREHIRKALVKMGDYDIQDEVEKLTDTQFEMLWYSPDFQASLWPTYDIWSRAQENEDGWDASENGQKVANAEREFVRQMVGHAKENYPRTEEELQHRAEELQPRYKARINRRRRR